MNNKRLFVTQLLTVDDEAKALREGLPRPLYRLIRMLYRLARKIPGATQVVKAIYRAMSSIRRRARKSHTILDPIAQYLSTLEASNGTTYKLADHWYDAHSPEVSIIILNWNKAALTAQCLHEIWKHTSGARYEIVVLDNGSDPSSLAPLIGLAGKYRFIRSKINRGFGEGNNIAVEAALGRFVVFLNNDAFVTSGWLEPLVAAIKEPGTGAAGPMFFYPNGVTQECGSFIDKNGDPKQRGKTLPLQLTSMLVSGPVHYISAACLLVERAIFMDLNGFSLDYEPAYYEDVDLCFRIRKRGLIIHYTPSSRIIHIENYSHKENAGSMSASIAINRDRFVARHKDVLGVDIINRTPLILPVTGDIRGVGGPQGSRIGIYTPFELTPGGGERYILTLASILNATLITRETYSYSRLRQLGIIFDLDLSSVRLMSYDRAVRCSFDIFISMGNRIVPDVPALAEVGLYLCQFPFPISVSQAVEGMYLLEGYQAYIAYSEYAKRYIQKQQQQLGLADIPTHVVYPPCVPYGYVAQRKSESTPRILSVGRFFQGGHCKNYHLLVPLFRKIAKNNLQMHIAGSLHSNEESLAYYQKVKKLAKGLPVFLHPNADAETLMSLYRTSQVYWHGTGMERDVNGAPETMEHFGISIVEAMGSGCVPIAYNQGGPTEIIKHNENGLLFDSGAGLLRNTRSLLNNSDSMDRMSRAAQVRAGDFSRERFVKQIERILLGSVSL